MAVSCTLEKEGGTTATEHGLIQLKVQHGKATFLRLFLLGKYIDPGRKTELEM